MSTTIRKHSHSPPIPEYPLERAELRPTAEKQSGLFPEIRKNQRKKLVRSLLARIDYQNSLCYLGATAISPFQPNVRGTISTKDLTHSMAEFFSVFVNVIMPVFGIVIPGYLVGGRPDLQTWTLSRVAYYVFVPAFIFQAISSARISLHNTLKMVCFIIAAHLLVSLTAGRLMRRSREMFSPYVLPQ